MYMKEQKAAPLVSVIMPAYNAEEFIEEAISSVQAQEVSDWELIVIDDGSQDGTQKIVEQFMQKDSRIRLIVNEANMGVGKSRNRGLDMCRGEYVALLDSDDYWKPQMLTKMIACAQCTNADIIYCSYAIVDEKGKKLCNDFIVPEETNFRQSMIRSVITCSTVLITKKIAENHRFPTDIYHEDIALWFQLLRDGVAARGVTDILAAYRQRENSKTANKLKSACRRWVIYRKHLNLPVLDCISLLIQYGYYGLIKFKRI